MTPKEAFDNLEAFYEDDQNHKYITESWQTLKSAVLAQQYITKGKTPAEPTQEEIKHCDSPLHNVQVEADGRCHWCESKTKLTF
jgi:hypothetical protein